MRARKVAGTAAAAIDSACLPAAAAVIARPAARHTCFSSSSASMCGSSLSATLVGSTTSTSSTSGADGLDAIRRIVADAPAHLLAGGQLWLEHGYDQADAVRVLLAAAGLRDIEQYRDVAGIVRVSGGRLP